VLVPLFSIPSRASWGVGEIADLPWLARWLGEAGLDFVQILPVNEMQEGQSSPYAALSAMAIDPVFISLAQVAEFAEAGGDSSLGDAERHRLAGVRASRSVDFGSVRALKAHALRAAFDRFRERHLLAGSPRAAEFRSFAAREHWWLGDYALFRALHDSHEGRYWREWDEGLRDRQPAALAAAGEMLAGRALYYQYLQWLAHEQWQRARRDCGRVGIFGDFPFMVSGHSADVWSRQSEFDVDAAVGVPPDAIDPAGQDWGLPAYRWDVMARGGYAWLRDRVRRSAGLYDGFRIDHLVGFYRTFVRGRDGRTYFTPSGEDEQVAQGERLLRLFLDGGARILVEDLGVVPDAVRASLARLGVPGLKVLRWERQWQEPGQPFRRPSEYPQASVATSGTHDTETLAGWWDQAGADERRLCADLPGMRESGVVPDAPYSAAVRDALLRQVLGSGSDLAILPVQDIFGWRDRVNTPAVVADENWTWRLPWPVDELAQQPESRERAAFLRAVCRESARG
jgi:4-alpha-glucanotransferase